MFSEEDVETNPTASQELECSAAAMEAANKVEHRQVTSYYNWYTLHHQWLNATMHQALNSHGTAPSTKGI